VASDNAEHRGNAESPAGKLGGEEGIEDAADILPGDAAAGVGNLDIDVEPFAEAAVDPDFLGTLAIDRAASRMR
jgi:hypothetical protein